MICFATPETPCFCRCHWNVDEDGNLIDGCDNCPPPADKSKKGNE